jgi:hypothetical protein
VRVSSLALVLIAVCFGSLSACRGTGDRVLGPECESIERAFPPDVQIVSKTAPHTSGYVTEARWELEVSGSPEFAKAAFRRKAPRGYQLSSGAESGFSYAKFDGNDSYSVTFEFMPATPGSTRIIVILRSMPG